MGVDDLCVEVLVRGGCICMYSTYIHRRRGIMR